MKRAACFTAIALTFFAVLGDAASPDPHLEWPRLFVASGVHLRLYPPQLTRWESVDDMSTRYAAAVSFDDSSEWYHGSFEVDGRAYVDLRSRVVTLHHQQAQKQRFSELDKEQLQRLKNFTRDVFATSQSRIALDRLLPAMLALQGSPTVGQPSLPEPVTPEFILSKSPAILIPVDGEPVFVPIPETAGGMLRRRPALEYLLNSMADVIYSRGTETYFLVTNRVWYSSLSLEGPWRYASRPPSGVRKIPDDHAKAAIKRAAAAPIRRRGPPPTIYTRYQPAELLVSTGEPEWNAVPGTSLTFVGNSRNAIFRFGQGENSQYYVLASGRWFRATALTGPYRWVPPAELPVDFLQIPVGHPARYVLACVPGASAAMEAGLLAGVPQRSPAIRNAVTLNVRYHGPPRFHDTTVEEVAYAVNTDYDVLRVGTRFVCCYRGVWFAADSPEGPWSPATKVPQAIKELPPTCPLYHVSFVDVHDYNDEHVIFQFTRGYLGTHYNDTGVVYGVGQHYSPFVEADIYSGYLSTYGSGVYYEAYRAGFVYGAASYTPRATRALRADYNPIVGPWGANSTDVSVYEAWLGQDNVGVAYLEGTADTDSTVAPRWDGHGDDVYAIADGQIFRWQDDEWQQYARGQWARIATVPAELMVEFDRRRDGSLRQKRFDEWSRSAASRPLHSWR